KIMRALVLSLILQICCVALSQAESPNMIGLWKVEITFPNGENRSFRFEAQDAGKGSLVLVDPRSSSWEGTKPSEATWSRTSSNAVTFSGSVEFLIGNVGRDAGTLVFKGKLESENLIVGDVDFSPLVGDRPSKNGTFKAIREPKK